MDCLFCKIAAGDIPGDIVYSDDNVIAFRDINPQAPHHILIIPRQHISTINDLSSDDSHLLGEMTLAAKQIAKQHALSERGYRLVMNVNQDAGQAVFHIHMHLLGGRRLNWPPG